MTPLRKRMIEDMQMRNFATGTQKAYLYSIGLFAKHFGRSPERLGAEHIREYLLHLVNERRVAFSTYMVALSALRFLYRVTLQRPVEIDQIATPEKELKLPVVLSVDEVRRLLRAATRLRNKALLTTAYAAGLRIAELVNLQIPDIDSERMVIRVRQGKGHKDRYVMLSPKLLELLRDYWREERPQTWLFPGEGTGRGLTPRTVQRMCVATARQAGITKAVGLHTLRHTFATHLLENGVDVRRIQALLGHRSLRTTAIYTFVSLSTVCQISSPFDLLEDGEA